MWYEVLNKPTWAPAPEVFGPVWTVLYILIIISFGYVGYLWITKRIDSKVATPFILNLVFNVAFTPLMFSLRNIPLATLDIVLVFLTLIWAMVAIYKKAMWVAWINLPYLLWVTFALVLQISILILNI